MNRVVAALLVAALVLASSTVFLYIEYRSEASLHRTARAMLKNDAIFSSSCLTGDLYNMRNLAGRNETLTVYILLSNARTCAQILSNYFNYLATMTGDTRYTMASTRLDMLVTWLQEAGQRLFAYNGSQARFVLQFLNQSQELLDLRNALREAQMRLVQGDSPPTPEQAAEIARAIDRLYRATPWIAEALSP